jgi:hypothetical protein
MLIPLQATAEVLKDIEKVTVVGRVDGSQTDPKGAALKEAFRVAVEQAVGFQVKSETMVQNAQLISDRILVKSEGYVKKWQQIREGRDGAHYFIEIEALVHRGLLNKDLFLNGIDVQQVYDWIGKPRLLVLINDNIDGKGSLTGFARAEVESLFKAKGVMVLSHEQLKNIQQRDVQLAFDRPDKAAALGKRFGAEIVIVGTCLSQFSRELDIAGFKQVFYSAQLDAKAYRTSNAEILMAKVYTETPGENDTSAMGKKDAAVRAIQNIVRISAKDIVYQVVKHWSDGLSKASTYQFIISGVKGSEATALEKYIAKLPDVLNVFRRSYNRGTAEIEVECNAPQSTLVEALENNKGVALTLVSEEPFRISFEKAK